MHFDAIILDLNMPIMDGHEACEKIIQIYKDYNDRQIALKDNSEENGDGLYNYDDMYVNRRPLMIASSAHITEEVQSNCLDEGFEMITSVPIQQEFLNDVFSKIE